MLSIEYVLGFGTLQCSIPLCIHVSDLCSKEIVYIWKTIFEIMITLEFKS